MNFLHRHRYKIIGTARVDDYIMVDIICSCGKTGTVYVDDGYEQQIYEQASKGKHLRVPQEAVLSVSQFNAWEKLRQKYEVERI